MRAAVIDRYNEPWPLAAVSLPVRLWRYRRMKGSTVDAGGLRWIARELLSSFQHLRRERRAVAAKSAKSANTDT